MPVWLVGSSGTEGSMRRASVPIPPWIEALGRSALARRSRTIELGAVEPAIVDIGHEVGDGLRRMLRIERERDVARRSDDADADRAGILRRRGGGEEQGEGGEQDTHGPLASRYCPGFGEDSGTGVRVSGSVRDRAHVRPPERVPQPEGPDLAPAILEIR